MHLCIMLYTYWTPLTNRGRFSVDSQSRFTEILNCIAWSDWGGKKPPDRRQPLYGIIETELRVILKEQ